MLHDLFYDLCIFFVVLLLFALCFDYACVCCVCMTLFYGFDPLSSFAKFPERARL